MLSQMLASTPVVRGADAGPAEAGGAPAAGGGGGGAFEEYGGVDPNVDPELAEVRVCSLVRSSHLLNVTFLGSPVIVAIC